MATKIRPEVSRRNRYWISKHRHYELKHFCLQYPSWKKACSVYSDSASIADKTTLIEKAVKETDCDLHDYILKAVTEGLSYTYLKTKMDIPCSRDTYYDRYRRFFWLLDKMRD